MNTSHVGRKFEAMGARIKVGPLGSMARARAARGALADGRVAFTIDLSKDGDGQFFDVRVADGEHVELAVLDVQPCDRHLLLMAKTQAAPGGRPRLQKFLCGHDERFWFVAGVPTAGVSTVLSAKEALKPAAVQGAQLQHGVKAKDRHRHKTAAFVRQGEWFFVPAPDLAVEPWLVLHREPLQRGGGKPHVAECLYRRGGTRVYVCGEFPNGLAEPQYRDLIAGQPDKRSLAWRAMVRDPEAYVKGRVRHPDHKTVVLPCWHRVIPNTEVLSKNVAFLD